MTERQAHEEAHRICREIEADMRRLGVVTTAHYEVGVRLIAAAILHAAAGAEGYREHSAWPAVGPEV